MWNIPSLPFLPGYTFTDPTKTHFGFKETLVHSQQCQIAKAITPDTAQYALELLDAENALNDNMIVDMTYGTRKSFLQNSPVPDVISFDKKVLRFYGYFREDIDDIWGEAFRIHHVKIHYYLADDTIEICEPKVMNSGLPQGLLLKRIKMSHLDEKGTGSWKDLNIGIDFIVFGKRIRITDCDPWTREYIESAGISLNPRIDSIPEDPFTQMQKEKAIKPVPGGIKLEDEKLYKFLNNDRKVLRFYGVWDDDVTDPLEKRKLVIQIYLMDDTVEVLEKYEKNCGRDEIPAFIRRQKIPKNLNSIPKDFPACYFEYTDQEVKEWFGPRDFEIGKILFILGRKILICDCDEFTRNYCKNVYGIQMKKPIPIVEEVKRKVVPKPVPPHTGLGTWDDSLQTCIYTIPKPPKKDVLKMLYNDDKILRFSAHMITPWPIDASRRFVIMFFPADDTVQIYERAIPNSGVAGGSFLKRCMLSKTSLLYGKPPDYYMAADFYIGAIIEASGRKFLIDDADRFVLTFMEENKELYTDEIINLHRQRTVEGKLTKDPYQSEKQALQEELRNYVTQTSGEEVLPVPLDFGEGEQPHDVVWEKLQSITIPLPREYLDKAMKICQSTTGNIDVGELKKILAYSLRQKNE